MPDSTTMRSRLPVTTRARVAVMALAALVLTGCAGSAAREPTVASVNFSPKLVLEVGDDGFRWTRGPRDDPNVTVPAQDLAPTVPFGTVMEVTNTGRQEHRVDAGKTFDTGRMQPGESMVVALTEEITEPKRVDIIDRDAPGHQTSLTVLPKPQS